MDPAAKFARRASALQGAALALLAMASCNTELPAPKELTSLRLTLRAPTEKELGSMAKPIQPTELRFDVQTLDQFGAQVSTNATVQAFLTAGGSRLLLRDPCGAVVTDGGTGGPDWLLAQVPLSGGQATGVRVGLDTPNLFGIFGTVALTLEEPGTRAQGATPPIYFPNPTVQRLMKPLNPAAKNATYCSPYLGRQVVIEPASAGSLVVSSVFANALSVSDSATPDWGSMYVYVFGQPSRELVPGRVVQSISGSIAKFNGMTQVANPVVRATDEIKLDRVPAPVTLLPDWRPKGAAYDTTRLGKLIAAPVTVSGIMCDVQDEMASVDRVSSWQKYATFLINQVNNDPKDSSACTSFGAFAVELPGQGFGGVDWTKRQGQRLTVTGMLQNSASKSGSTLFWTVLVRQPTDIQ